MSIRHHHHPRALGPRVSPPSFTGLLALARPTPRGPVPARRWSSALRPGCSRFEMWRLTWPR